MSNPIKSIPSHIDSLTHRYVLIARDFNSDGSPRTAAPRRRDDVGEELWTVSVAGKPTRVIHPFTEALDLAMQWAQETGAEIYRLDTFGATAELYKPTA